MFSSSTVGGVGYGLEFSMDRRSVATIVLPLLLGVLLADVFAVAATIATAFGTFRREVSLRLFVATSFSIEIAIVAGS